VSARVVVDGVPNEPVPSAVLDRLVEPILDLLGGIARGDVAYLRIDDRGIRAKVAARNKRGRRLPDSWAHVAIRVVDDREDES
jgi:hypothetical protein